MFFIIFFSSLFSRDSFFISRDIETIFSLCYWPLKVMVLTDPLLYNSQNLQSYCPCVLKACYRYSFETKRDRDLKLFPMSSVHSEGSSIYSYGTDLSPSYSSYCPWKYWNFDKITSNFFTIYHREFGPFGIEASTLAKQNDIKVKGQFHLEVC